MGLGGGGGDGGIEARPLVRGERRDRCCRGRGPEDGVEELRVRARDEARGEPHEGVDDLEQRQDFFFFFLRREEGLFRWCEGGERTRKTALAPPSFSLRFLQRTQGSEAEVRSLQYQVQKPIKGVEERDFEERVHR